MQKSVDIKRYTIVGMGLTGLSCARFMHKQGVAFEVVDSREEPPLKKVFDEEFSACVKKCGEFNDLTFAGSECLVVSPGMALDQVYIKEALERGVRLSSDIQLFVEHNDKPIIAITGSNGKSTVATLTGEIINSTALSACVAGNIGVPVLEQLISPHQFDVYVLELSSFQLERLPALNAKAVTILNVTEDHMDRYPSFNAYLQAKKNIFIGAESVVINADDMLTTCGDLFSGTMLSYGLNTEAELKLGLIDGREIIFFGDIALLDTSFIKVKGRHNISNVMAAMALCQAIGIPWLDMLPAINTFKGLRHRCEWVAEDNGVAFYNDSKATNVGAAVAAINGFSTQAGDLVLIAGGLDKDSDFSQLAEAVESSVKKVLLIGKDARKISAVLKEHQFEYAQTLQQAVQLAKAYAEPCGSVLFSPACASFDMFKNFEDRGDAFVAAVEAMVA